MTVTKDQSLFMKINQQKVTLGPPVLARKFIMLVGSYTDGSKSLRLYEEDNPRYTIIASTNIQGYVQSDGCFLIKNWTENEGLLELLLATKKFELTGLVMQSGFIIAHEVKYTG